MIRDEDEAIEQVLMGLRSAEMPVGMERRIAAAMEARAVAGERTSSRFWLTQGFSRNGTGGVSGLRRRPLAAMCVMAALAAVFLAVRLNLPDKREAIHTVRSSAPIRAEAGQAPGGVAHEIALTALPVRSVARVRPQPGRAAMRERHANLRGAGRRAESFPAPVAPLSAQEKALLVVARTGSPEEIAMLDPVARAKRDADDAANFDRFVGQAAKADHE